MATPDEVVTPLVADAIHAVINGNNLGTGDYILVAQATVGAEGTVFTWQWFWRPKDWTPKMSGGGSSG
jgi:hypothetical protein